MIRKIMDETNTGFMSHNGGLDLKKIDLENYQFSTAVKEIHLNSGKIAHGGFLSTVADTGMGTAAHIVTNNKRCVTQGHVGPTGSNIIASQTYSNDFNSGSKWLGIYPAHTC